MTTKNHWHVWGIKPNNFTQSEETMKNSVLYVSTSCNVGAYDEQRFLYTISAETSPKNLDFPIACK
jgi:hypothetical protein